MSLRERMARSSEKHKKRCASYQSEISILLASRQSKEQSFSEAVRMTFSESLRHVKKSIEDQEAVIRDDFCRTLGRYEKMIREKDDEMSQLREFYSATESKVESLEAEVSRLQRLVASKVHRERSSPYN